MARDHFWVRCTYGSSTLKKNTDLAYYRSNQSFQIAIQGYNLDEGKASDIGCHASKPVNGNRSLRLLKRWQYLGIVLWYVGV